MRRPMLTVPVSGGDNEPERQCVRNNDLSQRKKSGGRRMGDVLLRDKCQRPRRADPVGHVDGGGLELVGDGWIDLKPTRG